MASGGPRNRSGPPADPNSLTSGKKGMAFRSLSSEGYQGDAPELPFPDASDRELEVWAQLWRTPQAIAWIDEPWRWRTVAMYVRWSVRSEGNVPAAFLGQVHRLGDQIGLTPAGLNENGWAVSPFESEQKATGTTGKRSSSRARLKVVGNDG